MGLPSKETLEYDIVQDLKQFATSHRENHNSYYMDCPYCGKSNKFYIQKRLKFFTCFVCGIKGNIYRLVALLRGIDCKQAYKLIHNIEGKPLNYQDDLRLAFTDTQDDEWSHLGTVSLDYFIKINTLDDEHEAKEYLFNRDITKEMIKYFDLRYNEATKRVVFPIYFDNRIVGYQARDITGFQAPKIISSPKLPKADILFNYDMLTQDLPDSIVLTEGPVDCLKAYRHHSVALFGKYLSQQQLNLLLRVPSIKKVFIAIDPEERTIRNQLLKDLSAFWETALVPLKMGRDIGSYKEEEVGLLLKKSESVFDFPDKLII